MVIHEIIVEDDGNALRICIIGLAVGIVVLSGCVIGKYLFENGLMKASNPQI